MATGRDMQFLYGKENNMTGPITACSRCGYKREARPTSVLCKDCVDVLTVKERQLWKKAA